MSWIRFASEDELLTALASLTVPTKLAQRGLQLARGTDGAIWIRPKGRVARAVLEALSELGAERFDEVADQTAPVTQARCWAEVLRPVRRRQPEFAGSAPRGAVLFLLDNQTRLFELASEMLRLGCDRQQLARVIDPVTQQARLMIRAIDPPFYTVISAAEREGGASAYLPRPAGQTSVFTSFGWDHPLAESITSSEGLLLIDEQGVWREFPTPEWTDLYRVAQFRAPSPLPYESLQDVPRFQVDLRLVGSPESTTPSLWVMREDGPDQTDALLQSLPQAELDRLLFAVGQRTRDGGQTAEHVVVLRSRSGSKPPAISLRAESYSALRQLPQLFLPTGQMIEPPLRQERLVELLCPTPDQITWLRPRPPQADEPAVGSASRTARPRCTPFSPEHLPESAFRPLTDWVDYVIDQEREALTPWIRSATFDFEPIHVAMPSGGAPSARRPEPRDAPSDQPPEPPQPAMEEAATEAPAPPTVIDPARRLAEFEQHAPSELEVQLTRLEHQFVALGDDAPADAPERCALWAQMAPLHYALGNRRDGGQCWARHLWELGADADVAAVRWAEEERAQATDREGQATLISVEALVDSTLKNTSATRDDVRALAAQVIAASGDHAAEIRPVILARLHDLQRWFVGRDDALDVRTTWLARWALARLSDDALALTRARDDVLTLLYQGMSVQRDLPTFLRFLGRPGDPLLGQSGLGQQVIARLEALRTTYHTTPFEESNSATDAPLAVTGAYVDFLFAFAFARLGESTRAEALRSAAQTLLADGDEIQSLLSDMYSAHIHHALAGLSPQTPLPAALLARYQALEKYSQYIVDRLREWSEILEPLERITPFSAYVRDNDDPLSRRLATLRAIEDSNALELELASLTELSISGTLEQAQLGPLLAALLHATPRLGESRATQGLERLAPVIEALPAMLQVGPLEQGLKLAGHFGHFPLARRYIKLLDQLIGTLNPEQLATLGPTVCAGLRTLRRLGMDEQGVALLEVMMSRTTGPGFKTALARVQMAEGLAYFNRLDQAIPIFDQAQAALESVLVIRERMLLTRALAKALHQAPTEIAFERLDRLALILPSVTDAFNTNKNYRLSLVQFTESLILGHLNDDLALGELGRRWLDEDEYLVRRRIHRDYETGV